MSIPKTEMRNPASTNMDKMSSEEMARLVINANYDAVRACEDAAEQIAKAVDAIAAAFERGNRLFYIGAGTSGRLGVLDASECPPTFGVPYDMVQGIIAGGRERMFRAGENAEDKYDDGALAVRENSITRGDVLVGISENEIGVDIEVIKPYDKRLITRFFSEDEQKFIKSDTDFFLVWTVKEAFLKLTGEGLKGMTRLNVVKDNALHIEGFNILSFEENGCQIAIVYK